jgi:hypothetical protein
MSNDRSSKLIIVFIGFLVLLNYPIISIFDQKKLWMGFPVLYFYLFFLWLLIIVAVGLIVQAKQKRN